MPPRPSDGPVLFAYDGSHPAKGAIREAARQLSSSRFGIVLTVWEPLAAHPFAGEAAAWGVLEDDFEEEAGKSPRTEHDSRAPSASMRCRSRRAAIPSGSAS